MITQSINLNLIPGAVPPRIKVSQYDYGSRTLRFTLYNGTTTFTQAGLSARIQGTKPDGKGFSYDATYGSGIVTADITRQMTACAGAVTCELIIVNEELDEELGTGNFILDVEAAALSEDTDISETEIPAIIDAAEANAERAEAAAESAEAASAHAPYIGDNEHWYVWDTVQEQYVDSGVDAEGADGVGIVSIAKTSTVGLVDTYTITLSNGNTSTFTVTNGAAAVLPAGGTAGQALIKNSSTASDASWKDISATGAIKWTQAEGSVKKNLVKNNAVSSSKNGITYTVNEDGSISVYGTATANSNSEYISNNVLILKAGTYILSGCASGGSSNTFGLDIAIHTQGDTDYTFGHDYGSDYQFTVSGEKTFMLNVVIKNGVNMGTAQNPTVFYPMIRLASITDSTYAPYIPDNTELVSWEAASGDVQKNLLKNLGTSQEINGVTFTVNADGSVKAHGTASANATLYLTSKALNAGFLSSLSGKSVILSGGHSDNKRVQMWSTNGGVVYSGASDPIIDVTASIANSADFNIVINILSGQVCNNEVFYPMICKASVLDRSFTAYVPSNKELMELLTPQDITFTYDPDKVDIDYNISKRMGKCVFLNFRFHIKDTNASGDYSFVTLPSDIKPTTAFPVPCLITWDGNRGGICILNPSGIITAHISSAGIRVNDYYVLSVAFICA